MADDDPTTNESVKQIAQPNNEVNGPGVGVVTPAAVADRPPGVAVCVAREETRSQATNRWILEGRRWDVDRRRKDLIRQGVAAGLTRSVAADHAWEVVLTEFPPPDVEPSTLEMPEPIEPAPETPTETPPAAAEAGVVGLGDIPDTWPDLPQNASLAAEIQWVQASRLDVVEELPGGGTRVHLDRALSPAPSRAAIGWLETSIRAYSKYCDIAARATAQLEDEREHVRRERIAIDEIRALLAEMVDVDT